MNKFSWYEAKSVEDALEQVNSTVGGEIAKKTGKAAVLKAGGVDLLDMIKEDLLAPEKLVNIRNIAGLDQISDSRDGLRLGANVTLAEIEASSVVKEKYLALQQAVASAATPQIRNMATLGGNLAQRTRCWYFRSAAHDCLRKGGSMCFAKNGQNENHAILQNGTCSSVHASSVATALMIFGAEIMITSQKEKRRVAIESFFIGPSEDATVENILKKDEIITGVFIPAPNAGSSSYYIKHGARKSYDWSMGDVAVMIEKKGKKCTSAKIALGSAAPVPMRAVGAEKEMINKVISESTAENAAIAAVENAKPLSQNGYKIPLFQAIIKDAILNC